MKKIKNVFRYLHYTFGLLKLNIGTLLVFELLYKFASMAVFKPLLTGVMKLALKAQGLSYLSDETIGTFIRSPLTWFFLLLIVLGMAFFTLFDICCIITCIHASFRKQAMPLLALMRKGLKTSLRVIYQRNIVMILYLLIIIPMTHALVISGYITKFTVPQFIVDYIMSHTWLAILYIGFWIYIGLRSFHWIYSLHYFCLENCNFKQARKRSWKTAEKSLLDGSDHCAGMECSLHRYLLRRDPLWILAGVQSQSGVTDTGSVQQSDPFRDFFADGCVRCTVFLF